MIEVAGRWRLARWYRTRPGMPGLALAGLYPLVFFLPLGDLPVFDGRWQGAAILGWLGAFALGTGLGRISSAPQPSWIWLFQKGLNVPDFVLAGWLLDVGLAFAVVGWWGGIWIAADVAGGAAVIPYVGAFLALSVATFLVAHVFLFAVGATGWERATDLVVLLGLVSLLEPALLGSLEGWSGAVVHALLPPFRDAIELHGLIRSGDLADTSGPLFHITAFTTVGLTVGALQLRRWRPGG
jgi:hypothetical protein